MKIPLEMFIYLLNKIFRKASDFSRQNELNNFQIAADETFVEKVKTSERSSWV